MVKIMYYFASSIPAWYPVYGNADKINDGGEGVERKFRQTHFKLRSLVMKRDEYNKSVQYQEKNYFSMLET